MAIRSFENLKTDDLGETNSVVCPLCGNDGPLRLFRNQDASALNLLLKKEAQGFAVCPKCSAVFSVNPNYIEQRSIGTYCTLDQNDLKVLVHGRE